MRKECITFKFIKRGHEFKKEMETEYKKQTFWKWEWLGGGMW